MKIQCKLCGRWLERVGGQHLFDVHKMTSAEYVVIFPKAGLYSDEFIKSQSVKSIAWWENPENKEKGIQSNRTRWGSEEQRKLAAEKTTRHFENNPDACIREGDRLKRMTILRWTNPEAHVKHAEVTSKSTKMVWDNYTFEEKMKRLEISVLSSESLKASQETNREGPSKPEMQLYTLLNCDYPDVFIWNRDMKKRIGVLFPDIYSEEYRIVVESFGSQWHESEDEDNKVMYYQERGWRCIVIWADRPRDVDIQYNDVVKRINEIMEKGKELASLPIKRQGKVKEVAIYA